jgi:hypothetical protein
VQPSVQAVGGQDHGDDYPPHARRAGPRLYCAFTCDDRMTTSSVRPVALRNGVVIEDALNVVLGYLTRIRE